MKIRACLWYFPSFKSMFVSSFSFHLHQHFHLCSFPRPIRFPPNEITNIHFFKISNDNHYYKPSHRTDHAWNLSVFTLPSKAFICHTVQLIYLIISSSSKNFRFIPYTQIKNFTSFDKLKYVGPSSVSPLYQIKKPFISNRKPRSVNYMSKYKFLILTC